jgi:hypothetical protein
LRNKNCTEVGDKILILKFFEIIGVIINSFFDPKKNHIYTFKLQNDSSLLSILKLKLSDRKENIIP